MAVTRRVALVGALASLLAAADKKAEKSSRRIQVVELAIRRVPEDQTIGVEGRVRNAGSHPLKHVQLIFDVLAPSGEEVSRQRGSVDLDPFEPGDDFEFHWQMKDQARAVVVRVRAQDNAGRVIDVENPGPYTIE
jgi:hypothetical protein